MHMRYFSCVMTAVGKKQNWVTSLSKAFLLCITVCSIMMLLPLNAYAISGGGLPEQPHSQAVEGLWSIDGNGSIIKISCGQENVQPYKKLECYGYFVSIKKMNWRLPDQPLFSLQHYFYPDPNDQTTKKYVGYEYSGLMRNEVVGAIDIQFSEFNPDKLFYHLNGNRGEQRVTLTRVKDN